MRRDSLSESLGWEVVKAQQLQDTIWPASSCISPQCPQGVRTPLGSQRGCSTWAPFQAGQLAVLWEKPEAPALPGNFPECPTATSAPSHWRELCHVTACRRMGNVMFLSRGNCCPGQNRDRVRRKEEEGDYWWAACRLCPNIYKLIFMFATSLDPHKHVCCDQAVRG